MRKALLTSILAGFMLGCEHAPRNPAPDWIDKEPYYSSDGEFLFVSGKATSQDTYKAREDATTNAIVNANEAFDKRRNAYEKARKIYHQCAPWGGWSNGVYAYSLIRCDAEKKGKEQFQQVIRK